VPLEGKIDMKQIREVLRLHLIANLSARKIQGATGVASTPHHS